ncbi:MAG: hypothetical protein JW807_16610 [Spirochaetes bacterium]|nr:hypothetical protein [Spirochaetota bacterium]
MKRLFFIVIVFCCIAAIGQEKKEAGSTKTIAAIPGGYEGVSWGTSLSDARDKIRGKISYTDEKSIIMAKDGDLDLHYGFFYIDPALEGVERGTAEKETEGSDTTKADEGTLFYVALKFPYLTMDEVKKKIEDKYGPNTAENLHNMQGALAWNGENTVIIMWVDRYENKPYCRRITYLDKRITKELSDYQFRVFNRVELAILKKLGL